MIGNVAEIFLHALRETEKGGKGRERGRRNCRIPLHSSQKLRGNPLIPCPKFLHSQESKSNFLLAQPFIHLIQSNEHSKVKQGKVTQFSPGPK